MIEEVEETPYTAASNTLIVPYFLCELSVSYFYLKYEIINFYLYYIIFTK